MTLANRKFINGDATPDVIEVNPETKYDVIGVKYSTLVAAIGWINGNATSPKAVSLSPGIHEVTSPITISNNNLTSIKGEGIASTFIKPQVGVDGLSMITASIVFDLRDMTFDGSGGNFKTTLGSSMLQLDATTGKYNFNHIHFTTADVLVRTTNSSTLILGNVEFSDSNSFDLAQFASTSVIRFQGVLINKSKILINNIANLIGYITDSGDPLSQNIINLFGNPIRDFKLENLAVDPTTPSEGQSWFNTTQNLAKLKSSTGMEILNRPMITSIGAPGINVNASLTPLKLNLTSIDSKNIWGYVITGNSLILPFTGRYFISYHVSGTGDNGRKTIGSILQLNSGDILESYSANYATRNNTDNEGSLGHSGLEVQASAADVIDVMAYRLGSAGTFTVTNVLLNVEYLGE